MFLQPTVAWSDEYGFDDMEVIEEWEGGEMVPVVEHSPLPKISMGPDVGDGESSSQFCRRQ